MKKEKIVESQEQDFTMEKEKHSDYDLIAEKLIISRATTTEQFGSPNVYRAAQHLYAALYHPENIDNLIAPNEKYPNRMQILKQELSLVPKVVPSEDEFVAKVRHAMVSEVNFGECMSEEARKQLREVMEKSEQTFIWTDGDGEGVPEYNLPGSKEQLKKLATAQLYNKVRREIAKERDVKPADVLSVIAIEGKMKFISMIVEEFEKKGVTKMVIVEDRVKNLVKALELIKKTSQNMEVFPVWIQVGQYKNKIEEGKTLEEWERDFHAITDVSQLMQTLENGRVFEEDVRVGSVFDLDGPLHDDDKRIQLQTKAVIKKLEDNGWI